MAEVLVAVETNDLIRPVWLHNYNLGNNMERIAPGRRHQSEQNEIGLNRQRTFEFRLSSQYICKVN
jgi:hypothetical protein